MEIQRYKTPKTEADPGLLATTYENIDKQRDMQTYSAASDLLQSAEKDMLSGNFAMAGSRLKSFSDLTGQKLDPLKKGWLGGKYIDDNVKYIRDISNDFNLQTLKEYSFEAKKRGFNIEAKNLQAIASKANDASITPEAAVEVSAALNKMLSKMKYIDSPTGIRPSDIAELDNIKRKYSKEYEKVEKATQDRLNNYSNSVAGKALKGGKDFVGGVVTGLTTLVDLVGDVGALLAHTKNPIQTTKATIDAMGVDPNSFAYTLGNIGSIMFMPPVSRGVSILKATGSLPTALNVFNKTLRTGSILGKVFGSTLHYMVGKPIYNFVDWATKQFDMADYTRESTTNVASALGFYFAGSATSGISDYYFGGPGGESRSIIKRKGSGGSGGNLSIGMGGSEPTGGSGGSGGPEFPGSPESTGRMGRSESSGGIISIGEQINSTIEKGNQAAIDLSKIIDINANNSKANRFSKGEVVDTPNIQTQYKTGDTYAGAVMERTSALDYIKNVTLDNVESGAENVANYNTEITSEGTPKPIYRGVTDVAKVINDRAEVLAKTPPVLRDTTLAVYENEKGETVINNGEAEIESFVGIVNEYLPVTETIARMSERGSPALITRMMMHDDPKINVLGESLYDIINVAQYMPTEEGRAIKDMIEKELLDNKEVFFDLIGISEDKQLGIDLSKIGNKTYTGEIAAGAIQEIKSGIRNKFNPEYRMFETAVNNLEIRNPIKLEIALDSLRGIVLRLNEVNAETKTPLFQEQLKDLGAKLKTSPEHVVKYMTELLDTDVEDLRIGRMFKDSVYRRVEEVENTLRKIARKYDTDTIKKQEASIGSQGLFEREIYVPFKETKDTLFKSAIETHGEDPAKYDITNSEYAKFATLRKSLGRNLTDPTLEGEKIFRSLTVNSHKIPELLKVMEGQEIKAGSDISKLIQLLKAEGIKSILNITEDGEVIFKMENKKRFSFGKIDIMKPLLNEKQIKDLDEVARMGSTLADLKRGRDNPSGTKTLELIVKGAGDTGLLNQLDNFIKAGSTQTGISLTKQITKASKALKFKSLNKAFIAFNALLKAIGIAAGYTEEQTTRRAIENIIHAILNPQIQGLILSNAAADILNNGYTVPISIK